MAFCLVVGSEEFRSQLQGYEGQQPQCRNCGNSRTQCITRWPWFTVCFIPLIPLATHKYKEVFCYTCNFHQDLQDRPDIQPNGAGQPMQPYQYQNQNYQQGANQGWGGGGPPPQQGPMSPQGGAQGQNAGMPVYK